MELTILIVPECPHVALLRERLDQVLAHRPDVIVTQREITSSEEARIAGMRGSPTPLADGVDPFTPYGLPPSLSCRVGGLPTVDQLRAVLPQAGPA